MLLNQCKNVKSKKMEELVTINIGGTPSRSKPEYFEGNNKWVQISDMKEETINNTKEHISDDGVKNSNVKLIQKGDVMLSFKLSVGKIAYAGDKMYCNEAIAFFKTDNELVLNKFLFSYLENTDLTKEKSGSIGSGSLNKEKINNLNIQIPLKIDQEKIVKEMEKDNNLEKILNDRLKELDILIKNRFDYHVNKCKDVKKNDTDKKLESNSEEYEKLKKKTKVKDQNDNNEKSNRKSKKKSKIMVKSDDSSSELEDEKVVKINKKIITKHQNNSDSEDEKLVKRKK